MVVNDNFSKMARFISELRKEKKLTQKELAEQLGVTDKAVSKWERGLSCPDIALLSELSRVLGVTPGELLNGEKAEPADPQVDALVEATLHYADTATKSAIAKSAIAKSARWKPVAIVSGILLLGILILMGCQLGYRWRSGMVDSACRCHSVCLAGRDVRSICHGEE